MYFRTKSPSIVSIALIAFTITANVAGSSGGTVNGGNGGNGGIAIGGEGGESTANGGQGGKSPVVVWGSRRGRRWQWWYCYRGRRRNCKWRDNGGSNNGNGGLNNGNGGSREWYWRDLTTGNGGSDSGNGGSTTVMVDYNGSWIVTTGNGGNAIGGEGGSGTVTGGNGSNGGNAIGRRRRNGNWRKRWQWWKRHRRRRRNGNWRTWGGGTGGNAIGGEEGTINGGDDTALVLPVEAEEGEQLVVQRTIMTAVMTLMTGLTMVNSSPGGALAEMEMAETAEITTVMVDLTTGMVDLTTVMVVML